MNTQTIILSSGAKCLTYDDLIDDFDENIPYESPFAPQILKKSGLPCRSKKAKPHILLPEGIRHPSKMTEREYIRFSEQNILPYWWPYYENSGKIYEPTPDFLRYATKTGQLLYRKTGKNLWKEQININIKINNFLEYEDLQVKISRTSWEVCQNTKGHCNNIPKNFTRIKKNPMYIIYYDFSEYKREPINMYYWNEFELWMGQYATL